MFPRSFLSLPRSSRYLTFAKTMTNTAYIIPFDHQSSAQITDGLDPSKLWSLTPQGDKLPKVGTTRTFYNTPPSNVTTLSSLGEGFSSKKSEVKRELFRKSVGSAVKELKAYDGLKEVLIDASADPHAAGVFLYLIQPFIYIANSTVFF
jgi:aminopeptidase